MFIIFNRGIIMRNQKINIHIRTYAPLLLLIIAAMFIASCDDLLMVDAPTQVIAEDLDDPQFAGLLLNGAIADFEAAFGSYVVNSGLMGNELDDATITSTRWPVPQRIVDASDGRYANFTPENLGLYAPLSTARWAADNVLKKLEEWTDAQVENRQQRIATAAAYSGYSHLLLAEGFCTIAIDLSPELQPNQVFEMAEAKFTRAIEAARTAGDSNIENMALVGRARTRLNLGNTAGALADAQLIPKGFTAYVRAEDAAARRHNRVASQSRQGFITIAPAYRDLMVGDEPDPRVTVINENRLGQDSATEIYSTGKYTTDAADFPIASWREAYLIRAEVQGGQTAVGLINDLRAEHNLPAFSSNDANEIRQQVIIERQRELFLESHHLYDLTRYNLDLIPAPGTPYPKGGSYGTIRCFPLPNSERFNNPNIPN